MGGLLTTATDLGGTSRSIYRRGRRATMPKTGPVPAPRSARWPTCGRRPTSPRRRSRRLRARETGYGFGLRVTSDCRFEHIVAHGGGLPGFGSYMQWLPEYGVGHVRDGDADVFGAVGSRSARRGT